MKLIILYVYIYNYKIIYIFGNIKQVTSGFRLVRNTGILTL